MRKVSNVTMHVVLLFFAILFVIPFYVLLRNALATDPEITAFDWVWWPQPVQWSNFPELFADPFVPMARGFLNSTVITVLTTTFQTVFACMAGYALARIPWKGRDVVLGLVLSTMMIPANALFVPSFALVAKLGWVNTFAGLIVPGLFSAFNTFMFRQHFLDFPKELEDAARVDGLAHFGIFRRIVVPNSWGIVIALGSLTMVGSWNSFLWPLVIGQSRDWWTVQVNLAVYLTAQQIRFHLIFAGALLGALPMLIAFFFLQSFIAEGVARTGIKG